MYRNVNAGNEEKSSISSDAEDSKDDEGGCEVADTEYKSFPETKRNKIIFSLACKDFYDHLNDEQKDRFRDIFSKCQVHEIHFMLKSL